MIVTKPDIFDAFASEYDADFTHSVLGQLLRQRVWTTFAEYFKPSQHLLELTCGTGEDAVWLAQQGLHITATDASAEMIAVTEAKVEAAGVQDRVVAQQLSLQQVNQGYFDSANVHSFDGVYSNFGGLNTIKPWATLAKALASVIKPGGYVILVPMGPICLWEMGWYLAHLQAKTAFRRWQQPAAAIIGQATIPIWYPLAKRLKTDFLPWFDHIATNSLGLWLPPSYLGHFVDRWPKIFNNLNKFEQAMASLTGGWGDHYIIIFQRGKG